jgi:hypothetical protein
VVGNKCDIEDKRVVPTEDGKQLADKFGWSFMESSAKLRINVLEIFQEVCYALIFSNPHLNSRLRDLSSSIVRTPLQITRRQCLLHRPKRIIRLIR